MFMTAPLLAQFSVLPGGLVSIVLVSEIFQELRGEVEQLQSMVEAGLREAGEAEWSGGCQSGSWRRAVDIGRQLRDVLQEDALRLRSVEDHVDAWIAGAP